MPISVCVCLGCNCFFFSFFSSCITTWHGEDATRELVIASILVSSPALIIIMRRSVDLWPGDGPLVHTELPFVFLTNTALSDMMNVALVFS
jgi:hypothetical protein